MENDQSLIVLDHCDMTMEIDLIENDEISEDEAQHRIESFINLSMTADCNKAIAMMFLQDNNWDLTKALNEYREAIWEEQKQLRCASYLKFNYPPNLFAVLQWNIEGLNSKALEARLSHIKEYIVGIKPAVVCLQEVTPPTQAYLERNLSDLYTFHGPKVDFYSYYNLILVQKNKAFARVIGNFEAFKESVMERHVIFVDIDIDKETFIGKQQQQEKRNTHLRVYCTHLESCKEYSAIRSVQLKRIFNKMTCDLQAGVCQQGANILCGDLNIRDSEIDAIGGVPKEFQDIWQACGARPEAKLTWDPKRNHNCAALVSSKCNGLRFDRVYLGNSSCHPFKPVNFELQGIETVPRQQCHASDHWALLCHFDFNN